MKRIATQILLITALVAVFLPAGAGIAVVTVSDTADFTLVKATRGITLYERWYRITATESARELKATFTVRTSPAAAVALLKNGQKGELWNKNANVYEVVDVTEHSWVCYIEYDLPWPVKNQDCVLEYHILGDGDNLRISFRNVEHPAFPVKRRVDRIPEIRGRWIFKQSDDELQVEYYISTRSSKTLPTWLTDPIIRNNLIETINAFRSRLENQR